VDDDVDSACALANEVTVCHRADVGGKRGLEKVEPCDFMSALPQGLNETFTEVPGASRHKHAHPA